LSIFNAGGSVCGCICVSGIDLIGWRVIEILFKVEVTEIEIVTQPTKILDFSRGVTTFFLRVVSRL